MKEAKIYDLKLKNYREQVAEQHPSIDASAKRSKMVNGIETVTMELKTLNEEYKATLDKLLVLLNQLQDDESKLREFVSIDIVKKRRIEKESEFAECLSHLKVKLRFCIIQNHPKVVFYFNFIFSTTHFFNFFNFSFPLLI